MPELGFPLQNVEVRFYNGGIFFECLLTHEENEDNEQKFNFWLFLNYEGRKLGSYIYESRSGNILSTNRTRTDISFGTKFNHVKILL